MAGLVLEVLTSPKVAVSAELRLNDTTKPLPTLVVTLSATGKHEARSQLVRPIAAPAFDEVAPGREYAVVVQDEAKAVLLKTRTFVQDSIRIPSGERVDEERVNLVVPFEKHINSQPQAEYKTASAELKVATLYFLAARVREHQPVIFFAPYVKNWLWQALQDLGSKPLQSEVDDLFRSASRMPLSELKDLSLSQQYQAVDDGEATLKARNNDLLCFHALQGVNALIAKYERQLRLPLIQSADKLEESFVRFCGALEKLHRTTHAPKTRDGDSKKLVSKFGGRALLGRKESLPEVNGHALQLALQLVPDSLPKELASRLKGKVFQFFVGGDEAWGEWSDAPEGEQPVHMRLVTPGSLTTPAEQEDGEEFPAQQIVGWTKVIDGPSVAEHPKLGGEGLDAFEAYSSLIEEAPARKTENFYSARHAKALRKFLPKVDLDALYLKSRPRVGDKLGGWPNWEQDVEYPACARCEKQMSLLFQFNFGAKDAWTSSHLPGLVAGDGTGMIFQCDKHLEEFEFSWATG